MDFHPPLSQPHRLARKHSSKTLVAAAAARIGAELLSDSRDGAVPEDLVDRYARAFKRWIVEAIESAELGEAKQLRGSATLPERMQQQEAGDDDEIAT